MSYISSTFGDFLDFVCAYVCVTFGEKHFVGMDIIHDYGSS